MTKIIARQTIKYLFVTIILALPVIPAMAWNNVGHRAIAELAWRRMDNNERHAASELLKQHPHYKLLLAVNVPAGVDTNEWVFISAAVWPDWVRPAKVGQHEKPESITKYDLYPHAIGYPFLGEGETNRTLLENFYIAKPNAEMVLADSIATLNNSKASAHDRAVSLCWILHLFGDLHQPLHAANVVTTKRPRGDRLGGHHIALNLSGKKIDFHSFWDQLPGTNPSYKSVASVADEVSANPALRASALLEYQKNKTITAWVQESFRIAVDFAYSPKHVRFVHNDDLESGKISAAEIPALSAEYVAEARKIALQRVALAGHRLTDEVKKAF